VNVVKSTVWHFDLFWLEKGQRKSLSFLKMKTFTFLFSFFLLILKEVRFTTTVSSNRLLAICLFHFFLVLELALAHSFTNKKNLSNLKVNSPFTEPHFSK